MKRPNVLLLTADQLRYDCLGSSGRYPVRTPYLDRLAEQGAVFPQAYSHIPVCGPSRQSLLCGRRPETFGGLWNAGNGLPIPTLDPGDFSWPRLLADNGYATALIGKWGVDPRRDAVQYGYGRAIDEKRYERFAAERYPDVKFTNGFFGEANPIPVASSRTHWLADQAIGQLEAFAAGSAPWHLAVHFPEPHLPCRPSGKFADMYAPDNVPEWDGFRETFANKPYIQKQMLRNWGVESFDWVDWAPVVARYYGVISQLDEAIGSVLAALDRLGLADDTLVVFTADHGDMCGSHRMMDKHYILYDDVVRVPFIVRWPGRVDAGAVCDRFVYNFLDLAPTIADAIGLRDALPSGLHGESLLPLFGQAAEGWRDCVVSTYSGQQFGLFTQRMIRTARWKYVWNHTDTDELYDLAADPAELFNRIGDPDAAPTLAGLRRRLHERLLADGDPLADNEWMRRQLLQGAKI